MAFSADRPAPIARPDRITGSGRIGRDSRQAAPGFYASPEKGILTITLKFTARDLEAMPVQEHCADPDRTVL